MHNMCVWMGSVGYALHERCGLIGFSAASSLHCKTFVFSSSVQELESVPNSRQTIRVVIVLQVLLGA
jgi:hypothetical protein